MEMNLIVAQVCEICDLVGIPTSLAFGGPPASLEWRLGQLREWIKIMQTSATPIPEAPKSEASVSIVPDYYQVKIPAHILAAGWLDMYQLAEMFEVKDHAIFQAAKKLLVAGKRSAAKNAEQDVHEALVALIRWHELNCPQRWQELLKRLSKE